MVVIIWLGKIKTDFGKSAFGNKNCWNESKWPAITLLLWKEAGEKNISYNELCFKHVVNYFTAAWECYIISVTKVFISSCLIYSFNTEHLDGPYCSNKLSGQIICKVSLPPTCPILSSTLTPPHTHLACWTWSFLALLSMCLFLAWTLLASLH